MARAIIENEIEHSSVHNGNAYSWDSLELDIDATDTMLFVKNISDSLLILDRATILGSNVICTWEILIGALTTTPAGGAEVIGVNLNEVFSTKLADAVARSDETALADGSLVDRIKTAVSETLQQFIIIPLLLGYFS